MIKIYEANGIVSRQCMVIICLTLLLTESPAMATQKIYFKDSKIHERSPSEIRITWEKQNLTTNENANIRLSLWGYRETNIRPTFVFITQLADNIQNTGEYTIVPSMFRTRSNEFLTDIKFGFLQLNLTESVQVCINWPI